MSWDIKLDNNTELGPNCIHVSAGPQALRTHVAQTILHWGGGAGSGWQAMEGNCMLSLNLQCYDIIVGGCVEKALDYGHLAFNLPT